jgi:hypothetical protein
MASQTASDSINDELIALLAQRCRKLERRMEVILQRYVCHTEDCPKADGYPCTCGAERLKI